MKTSQKNFLQRNKNILLIALATGLILLLPLAANLMSDEQGWSAFDFILAGGLLFGTGLAFELVARKAKTLAYRAAVALALGTALLLLWVNMAVGIIGSEDNPTNLLYFVVLAVLFLGVLWARFRPQKMMQALFATAGAQAAVTVAALLIEPEPVWVQVIFLNGFFVTLWLGAALLFRWAAENGASSGARSVK